MAQSHKAQKSPCHASRTRKSHTPHKPQFVRTTMKQSRGPQHTTVEGFIASLEAEVEAQRELQEFE